MSGNGILMNIVTEPKRTIGMAAYGIAIRRASVIHFVKEQNLEKLGTILL